MNLDPILKRISQFASASNLTVTELTGGITNKNYKITVDGELVDYMTREEPQNELDSGWQFFSGTEDQEYIDNPDNSTIYDVNTIANYDPAIIPYLDLPIGTQLERVRGTDKFQIIPG